MEKAKVNGVELEYETTGQGEPVLLISTGPIADSFRPLLAERALTDRYRLITYHQRGQVGSTHSPPPVSVAQHAADAAALLAHLGIGRAHVAGHSTGGVIALQLASDRPDMVHSLALLEPLLLGVPSAGLLLEKAGSALAAYESGDAHVAMAGFLSSVTSLDWDTCAAVIEKHVPGGVRQAMQDAHTVFCSYLPAVGAWQFGPDQARDMSQPVLSVLGSDSERLFVDGRELLSAWFPQTEVCTISDVAHLLHMQRPTPVAHGVGEFFGRHPIG